MIRYLTSSRPFSLLTMGGTPRMPLISMCMRMGWIITGDFRVRYFWRAFRVQAFRSGGTGSSLLDSMDMEILRGTRTYDRRHPYLGMNGCFIEQSWGRPKQIAIPTRL